MLPCFATTIIPRPSLSEIDQLMVAAFLSDHQERIRRMAEHLADDFVYISPSAVVDGAEGLSDAFSHYRHDSPQMKLLRTTDVDAHHTYFRFAWRREQAGRVDLEGWAFGWLNPEGKIGRLVSFDGLTPGQHP